MSKKLLTPLLVILYMAGCTNDIVGTITIPENEIYYHSLKANHRSILIAKTSPYDTVSLKFYPFDSRGNEWRPEGIATDQMDSVLRSNKVTYTISDSTKLKIDSTGLLTALSATTATGTVTVIGARTFGLVTKADTVLVRISAVAPTSTPLSFTFRTDSGLVGSGATIPFRLQVTTDGVPLPVNPVIAATSSDSTVIGIGGPGRIQRNPTAVRGVANSGTALVTSEAYVYGVVLRDSFEITSQYPITAYMIMSYIDIGGGQYKVMLSTTATDIHSVNISPGAHVYWVASVTETQIEYLAQNPYSIIFEDPSVALAAEPPYLNTGAGNVVSANDYGLKYRRFLTKGSHKFTIEPYGIEGVVNVK